MPQVSNYAFEIGDSAPNCTLPDGTPLSRLRGQPVVLAFAPDEWNPGHVYQSEVFQRLSQDFGDGAAFIDASAHEWRSLDNSSDLATQFGVEGRRALFLLDEEGSLRWKIAVEPGQNIPPGAVIAALESLRSPSPAGDELSRRTFLTATVAAAAVLMLPIGSAEAAPNAATRFDTADPAINYDRNDTIPVTLNVNGKSHQLQIEPRVALLDALREYLHLTGTKKGCDHGQCGACTVHINGRSALSCLTLAVMNQNNKITTIEGISSGETLHPVQAAFIKYDAFQCGYCTPGQIMSATALIKDKRVRSEAEIRDAMSGNLCRCAAYPNIIAAVKEVQSA